MNQPDKILLLTTSHVGNNIICTPAINLLKRRFPAAQIDVIAMSKRGGSVFVGNNAIHRIIQTASKFRIRRLAAKYPLVIGLHHDKAMQYLNSEQAIIAPAFVGNKHRADELLEFVSTQFNSEVLAEDRNYGLFPQSNDFTMAQQLLKFDPNNTYVGLHIGNGITAVHGWKFWYRNRKRAKSSRLWALEDYIDFAKMLKQSHPQVRLVITGSSNEKFLGKQFVKQVPETINLIGKTSLMTLTAIMHSLKVFVTQDTGPLHVACATQASLVGLFGATKPECTGPYPVKPQHTLIIRPSMAEIKPEEVYNAVINKIQ